MDRRRKTRARRELELLESRVLLAADLIAHWRATDLEDTLTNGQTVTAWTDRVANLATTVVGTPTFARKAVEGRSAMRFNADDGGDAFQLPNGSNPIDGRTDFSVVVVFATATQNLRGGAEPWYKATGLVDGSRLGLAEDWGVAMNATGQVGGGLGPGFASPPVTLYTSRTGLNDGNVHVVSFTRAGSELGIKVDAGGLETRSDANDKPRSRVPFSIGSLVGNTGFFTGDIAEVRLYGGRLTNDELNALHTELGTYYLDTNTPPLANDDLYQIDEDAALEPTTQQGVLANDRDQEGNPLQVVLVNTTEHGTLNLADNGSFRYVPNAEYAGSDSFTYKLFDGLAESPVATVHIEIATVNDAPHAATDLFVTFPGEALTISASAGVLANDTDVELAPLTARVVERPQHGQLTFNVDGSFTYRPDAGFQGLDGFRYLANDGQVDSTLTTSVLMVADPTQRVVINEVHYDPPDNTLREEFIELFNQAATPVDLSNWYFTDGVTYIFPAGTIIQPGQYLVVSQDPATLTTSFAVNSLGPWVGRLSSNGERIVLRDASGAIVDEVSYQQAFPWPIAAGGEGPSMERIHPSLDSDLGGSWRSGSQPTPGQRNSVYTTNAPPQARQVNHVPQQPTADQPTTVTAKVTDPNGVASVRLQYQIVLPGQYIPALLPVPLADLRRRPATPRQPNPAYEDPANWTQVDMFDDGTHGDSVAGDAIFTAVLPGQAHRTLVRYRITVADTLGSSVRVPYADDASRNFAYFVYNGVPDYNGTSHEILEGLPVYHLLTRAEDMAQVMAYPANQEIAQGSLARFSYNWPATFVYDGVVYDHINYRLRGANGRYQLDGKRSMRFRFNDGHYLQAKDQDGKPYPEKWRTLTTGKMFDNRLTLTYSLNEAISYRLYDLIGVPSAWTHYAHFRVVDSADENGQYTGDFWGLTFVIETYDIHFLDAHGLPHGNMYKLINQTNSTDQQRSYQAPDAVKKGEDHDNIERNLNGKKTPEYIDAYVNLEKYYLFHALAEAIRHYDYWPDANKNMVYYFEPTYLPENNNLGKLVIMPWDIDASWGPTWNDGHDVVYDALFASTASGGDREANPSLWPAYFSTVREIRDLIWQPDQLEPLLAEFAAIIKPLEKADADRWKGAPASAGNYNGLTGAGLRGIDALVQDMKNFAFVGGSWPGGNVGAGGRAAFLDTLQGSLGEGTQLPATPAITYVGGNAYPADQLRFTTSSFTDPQGNDSFGAMEWRIAEVTDPQAPAYDPRAKVKLEWTTSWESGELTQFGNQIAPPASAVTPGHAYRARVRMKDNTGRWSHWSAPIQFIASAAVANPLADSLRVSEVHYHPADPTQAEVAAGFNDADDFEFIELVNRGTSTIDLASAAFVDSSIGGQSQGIAFAFRDGAITTLGPGERVLVVEDQAAFEFRYGAGHRIAGEWTGSLSNGGEQLTLMGDATIIQQFIYNDAWYPTTDGAGFSLEVVDIAGALSQWNQDLGWRPSAQRGGTPGVGNAMPGDSNHDGKFNSADLVAVFQAGEYEDDVAENSLFEEGDWDGDGDFTTADLVLAFTGGNYLFEASPESLAILALGADLTQPAEKNLPTSLLMGHLDCSSDRRRAGRRS